LQSSRVQFNDNWKFIESEDSDNYLKDIDDSSWRILTVPHDWSIEKSYDRENCNGATGYLPGGIGWYRKHFKIDFSEDKKYFIHFDGVYNNSEIWLNNNKIGIHPYGYSPFYFDLTEYINKDGNENVLAVKVDRSRYIDSRWYSGSGIYRDVEFIEVSKLYIPVWGSFITTPEVGHDHALLNITLDCVNDYNSDKKAELKVKIYDNENNLVLEDCTDIAIGKNSKKTTELKLKLNNPKIWDLDNPYLYRVEYSILENNHIVDIYSTTFGVRTFSFNPDNGFIFNGKNIKIKGVCIHHDGGLVGAAVPKDVWKRRLLTLKEGGCNALRIAHNPASSELLALCDELGMLVQDEFFDEWDNPKDKRLNGNEQHDDYVSRGYAEFFQEWAETDLKNTMLSHRNHPSIFQWSIGNEIEWTYPKTVEATGFFGAKASGNYFWTLPPNTIEEIRKSIEENSNEKYDIGRTAQKLAKWTRELDTTRPVIANCILPSASLESGYADALDIVGFSYRRVMYDYAHKNYPNKVFMGTENLGQWHEWKAVMDRDFISGTFLWTGIDYLGEAHRHKWPQKGTYSGLLDFAGFEKPSYYMYKSLWSEKPSIYMVSRTEDKSSFKVAENGEIVEKKEGAWETLLWVWDDVNLHWNYSEGEGTIVEVYSNCQSVELFLNGKSLGEKKLNSFIDHIYKWFVPFSSGELKAVGKYGEEQAEYCIKTNGEVAGITLTEDRRELNANGLDCVHIVAQLVDSNGNPVTNKEEEIKFEITGSIKNLGVDNGSRFNVSDHKTDRVMTNIGKALIILQADNIKNRVNVKAISSKVESEVLAINIK